mgnify:CR=1 FL=1
MMKCPICKANTRQHKIGFTQAQSQRYKCQHGDKRYTPEPKPRGYPESLRKQALKMYVDGINFRRIGRLLDVHHQSVINWVNAYADQLPDAPVPDKTDVVEMDELYTFIREKKTEST